MTEERGPFSYYESNAFNSWTTFLLASKSLVNAMKDDDPEQTVLLQLTLAEASMFSFALLVFVRLFPEFLPPGRELSKKIAECADAQGFLRGGSLDSE